jgi:polar amino acid transport system substrate-binding protein
MTLKLFLATMGMAVLLTGACRAQAAETIAVDEANPPFMYAGDGKAAGIYPALLDEAFKRMAVPVAITAMPWKRAIAGIDAGQNGVGGIYQNAERLTKYDFSAKLFDEVILVYVPKAKPFPFKDLSSLKGKTVGVIRGWSYGDDFDAAVKNGTIATEGVAADSMNFAKLAVGHLDAVLAIKEAGNALLAGNQDYGAKIEVEALPLTSNPSYLAFAKSAGKAPLLGQFDKTLAAMRADGSFDKIVATAVSK